MYAMIFLFTNPISLAVYYIAFEIIRKIISLTGLVIWDAHIGQRLLVFGVIILISCIAHFNLLFTDDSQPSMVDASPIASLTAEQINRLEDVVMQLDDYEFIGNFRHNRLNFNHGMADSYGFVFRKEGSRGTLSVSITFHGNEHVADMFVATRRNHRYTHVTYDNGTEVILFDSRRLGNAFHTGPIEWRYLRTVILIGDAIIFLQENVDYDQLHMNVATDFIAFFYEFLTQEDNK